MNIDKLRENYPITKADIFLNHAATSPIARTTIDRIENLAKEMQRPLSEHFYPWLGIIEDTRRRVAELIHAHPSEIAFCQNTSSALSTLAQAIPFQLPAKVLVPRDEFPSNIYAWQNLRAKGIEFAFFDIEPGVPVIDTLAKLSLEHVQLLAISSVSFYTGRLYELKDIVDFCHQRGIWVCFDAIQAIGTVDINVHELDVDFLASGAQKWLLGSIGVGFIYAKKAWLDKLYVPLVGWTSIKYPENFNLKELDFSEEMTRFEPGLPDILPIAALNQSLINLESYGWDNIYQRIAANTGYLTEALQSIGITTLAANDLKTGIVSFTMPKMLDKSQLLNKFLQKKIHITERDDYLRVSPHFYNTQNELDTLLTCLEASFKPKSYVVNSSLEQAVITKSDWVIINGATGVLGTTFAKLLATQGYHLHFLGQREQALVSLCQEIEKNHAVQCRYTLTDLGDPRKVEQLCLQLKQETQRYTTLINCAGIAYADECLELSSEQIAKMLQINSIAAFTLMQTFIRDLKADTALGILNIVSPTGRCGYPLLAGYAASHAALWSFSEIIQREIDPSTMTVTTYVASAMHSRLQKRLGRVALRFFKLTGVFDYEQATHVAHDAWQALLQKQDLKISRRNRLTALLNTLFPSFMTHKIRKIWKHGKFAKD